MPYKLVILDKNNIKTEVKPLANDNPNGNLDDIDIMRKGAIWANKISKRYNVKCFLEKYKRNH
jgi:sugar lactone lactonase YvrE